MAFNSINYLIFLPLTVLIFYGLGYSARLGFLILASLVFYAFWSVPLLSLIVLSAANDYAAGLVMGAYPDRPRVRKTALFVSLALNLGLLGYFKYSNFFLENFQTLFGQGAGWEALQIALPPGISFYTFQTMSYTIDVYRGTLAPTKSFLRFFLYVMYFPQLVAGPIERAGHLLVQFDYVATQRFRVDNLVSGLQMILWGLFKKVMIADNVGRIVELAYADPGAVDGWTSLVGAYAFTLQIYCDFSAYSEIAKGSARMIGVDLMDNFDQPYLVRDVSDFWRRWHISLSTWIRDYVYIPLGGNRVGPTRALFNAILTMFVSGLWHGAAWNYVAWGFYHGVLLALLIALRRPMAWLRRGREAGGLERFGAWALTFHLVVIGWILFRVREVADAGVVLARIGELFFAPSLPNAAQAGLIAFMGLFLGLSWLDRSKGLRRAIDRSTGLSTVFYAILIVVMMAYARGDGPQFIYFQF